MKRRQQKIPPPSHTQFMHQNDLTPLAGRAISLQAGRAQTVPGFDPPFLTSVYKLPLAGSVAISQLGLEGDEQADRRHHGGADMALCVFPSEHFAPLGDFLGSPLAPGAFGENVTTEGLLESDVCIGDTFAIGSAVVQITKPREPCGTLSRRHGNLQLPRQMLRLGRFGWYLRVLQDGQATAGDTLALTARPHPEWTVARAMTIRIDERASLDDISALAACDALAANWRQSFLKRIPPC